VTTRFDVPQAGPAARAVSRVTRAYLGWTLIFAWVCVPVLLAAGVVIPLTDGVGFLALGAVMWFMAAVVAGVCWFLAHVSSVHVLSFASVEFYLDERPPVLWLRRGRRSRVRPLTELTAISVRYIGSGGSTEYHDWQADRDWYPYLTLLFRKRARRPAVRYCVGVPMDGSSMRNRGFTSYRRPARITGELRQLLAGYQVTVTDEHEPQERSEAAADTLAT
jgi:hypothetical protein